MLLEKDAKRLSIFAYYDADGIVDDYVIYLLEQVQAYCAAQIVVVNGTLNKKDEARIKACCTQLLYRPNEGFDITAYKEAFLQAENIDTYDEVLFYNQTVFGPVCSLQPVFDTMAQRDVDFWGITRHKGAQAATWDYTVSFAPHVQSFFFAVRKSLFCEEAFTRYWQQLPTIETYWDAVSKHEVLFTKYFADRGYQWDVYLNTEDLEQYNDYPLMGMPTELLARGCPFVKRKSFLSGRNSYATVPQGAATHMLYDWLCEKTTYPVRMVLQNLLRTTDPATLQETLDLFFDVRSARGKAGKNVAVLWFAQEALAPMLCKAAQTLQKDTSLICLFATEELKETYAPQLLRNVCCVVTEKNGAEYMFGVLWGKLEVYENILYLHNNLPLLLREFPDATTFGTAVESLVPKGCDALLSAQEELGAVVAMMPLHQENLVLGTQWPQIAPQLREPLRQAGITVPLGEDKPGFAVRGGMFFARTQAVQPLTKFAFEAAHFEGDYPAWEYLVPFAVQSAGYLTAISCPLQQAYTSLANNRVLLRDMVNTWATPRMRTLQGILFRQQVILDFYYERRHQMTLEQAFRADLTLKQKIWICAQIFLKPETFAKLHKKSAVPAELPKDELE